MKKFLSAVISTGTYNTSDYKFKQYKTASGLKKGLKALGYFRGLNELQAHRAWVDLLDYPTWQYNQREYTVKVDLL